MIEWCIFYVDGTEISNLDSEPQNVPTRGVLVIAQVQPDCGWAFVQGGDYFIWDDRGDGYQWYSCDIEGRIDYEIKNGWKKVLVGIQISHSDYDRIFAKVKRDKRFPQKTTFGRFERRPFE